MNVASRGVPVLVALAFTVAALPAPAAPPEGSSPAAETFTSPGVKESPYPGTAIGALIEANGGKLPASGAELTRALQKLGPVVQLSFPFSGVALDSGLSHPRVVMTLR